MGYLAADGVLEEFVIPALTGGGGVIVEEFVMPALASCGGDDDDGAMSALSDHTEGAEQLVA